MCLASLIQPVSPGLACSQRLVLHPRAPHLRKQQTPQNRSRQPTVDDHASLRAELVPQRIFPVVQFRLLVPSRMSHTSWTAQLPLCSGRYQPTSAASGAKACT